MADPQPYYLIKNVYKPHETFDFPETDQNFKFVSFQEFPWLCYLRWEDEAYYMYRALLGRKSTSNLRMVTFYSQPIRKWPVTAKSFKEHANTNSSIHSDCKNLFNRFLDQCKGREIPVKKMVDSNYKTNIKKSRETNASIAVKLFIVKFCRGQNIPLCVDRDRGNNNQS